MVFFYLCISVLPVIKTQASTPGTPNLPIRFLRGLRRCRQVPEEVRYWNCMLHDYAKSQFLEKGGLSSISWIRRAEYFILTDKRHNWSMTLWRYYLLRPPISVPQLWKLQGLAKPIELIAGQPRQGSMFCKWVLECYPLWITISQEAQLKSESRCSYAHGFYNRSTIYMNSENWMMNCIILHAVHKPVCRKYRFRRVHIFYLNSQEICRKIFAVWPIYAYNRPDFAISNLDLITSLV